MSGWSGIGYVDFEGRRLRIQGDDWPSSDELLDALLIASKVLGSTICWAYEGRYHFRLDTDWTLALSADSADRIRFETCHLTRPRSSMWARATDQARLAALAERMSSEIREPV